MGRSDAYPDTRTVAVSDGFFRLEQGDGAIHFRAVDTMTDDSGQFETWVGSLTTSSARQLSAGGGIEPVWCRCNEIFFRRGNKWLSARVILGEPPTWETPRSILMVDDFLDTPGRSYDVSSDGQKLFVVQRTEPAIDDRIHVVTNWFEELKRLVPSPHPTRVRGVSQNHLGERFTRPAEIVWCPKNP